METFSALLALCAENSPVPVTFPHRGQWRGALMFFFDLRLNKRLNKQPWGWRFEMPSWSLWRRCNGTCGLLPCMSSQTLHCYSISRFCTFTVNGNFGEAIHKIWKSYPWCYWDVIHDMYISKMLEINGKINSKHSAAETWLLTDWGRDNMAGISQMTFSNAFSWMKMCELR